MMGKRCENCLRFRERRGQRGCFCTFLEIYVDPRDVCSDWEPAKQPLPDPRDVRIAALEEALRELVGALPWCEMPGCGNCAACWHVDGYFVCDECRADDDRTEGDWSKGLRAALAVLKEPKCG